MEEYSPIFLMSMLAWGIAVLKVSANSADFSAELRKRAIKLTALGALGFCIGLAFASVQGRQLWRGYQTRKWPSVSGVVTSSFYEVKKREVYRRQGFSDSSYVSSFIEYRYAVGESNYVSRMIKLRVFSEENPGESLVQRHPVGIKVAVHFNPSNPGEALLLPGPRVWNGVFMMLGIGCVIVGIRVFRSGVKELTSQWRRTRYPARS